MHLDKKIIIALVTCTLTAGIVGGIVGSFAGKGHGSYGHRERGSMEERDGNMYRRSNTIEQGKDTQPEARTNPVNQPTVSSTTKSN
jgi:hypothetical protein